MIGVDGSGYDNQRAAPGGAAPRRRCPARRWPRRTAGGGALYLSSDPGASPSQVQTALKTAATTTANKSRDGRTIVRLYVASF